MYCFFIGEWLVDCFIVVVGSGKIYSFNFVREMWEGFYYWVIGASLVVWVVKELED